MQNRAWISLVLTFSLLLTACSSRSPGANGAPQEPPPVNSAPTGQTGPAPPPANPPTQPAPSPELPARPAVTLPVKLFPNSISRTPVPAGAPFQINGLYFVDRKAGTAERWTLAHHPSHVMLVPIGEDRRWVRGDTPVFTYLIDRKSEKVWQWERKDLHLVSAAGDRLLLELRAKEEAIFVIADQDLVPVSSFTSTPAPNDWSYAAGLFSRDGRRLLFLGHDGIPGIVDTATGKMTALPKPGTPKDGFGASPPELSLSQDGEEIRIIVKHHVSRGDWRPEFFADIHRYDWEGRETSRVLTVPGYNPRLSPDGKLVAYDHQYQGKMPTVVVADAQTGKPLRWVRSGSLCYQASGAVGDRWLADGSGLILRTRDGFSILTMTGELRTNPLWSQHGAEPIPAPDSPDLFTHYNRALVDSAGKIIMAGPKAPQGLGEIDPWGRTSEEMAISVPQLGHGPRCGFLLLLPPRVETAEFQSYGDPLVLQSATPGDCLNLRSEPGGKAIRCLPNGTALTVIAPTQAVPPLMVEQPLVEGAHWVHVRTRGGEEGWVAANKRFLDWAR